jgi:predicted GNAT family acetyltransferase
MREVPDDGDRGGGRPAIGFVVEADRAQLGIAALNPAERRSAETIIRVHPQDHGTTRTNNQRRTPLMTEPNDTSRYAFEYPDEAGYPDGKGTLSQDQIILIDDVIDDPHAPAFDFSVVNNEETGVYEATVGDTEIAALPYDVAGDDRLVLQPTSVFPQFRKQGVATELIRRVLDDVRAQGKTVTIMCPIVRTFVERHPEYGDLVDAQHPGVVKGSQQS